MTDVEKLDGRANTPVCCIQATAFLADVATALGKGGPRVLENANTMLKRGHLCTALKQLHTS